MTESFSNTAYQILGGQVGESDMNSALEMSNFDVEKGRLFPWSHITLRMAVEQDFNVFTLFF